MNTISLDEYNKVRWTPYVYMNTKTFDEYHHVRWIP